MWDKFQGRRNGGCEAGPRAEEGVWHVDGSKGRRRGGVGSFQEKGGGGDGFQGRGGSVDGIQEGVMVDKSKGGEEGG